MKCCVIVSIWAESIPSLSDSKPVKICQEGRAIIIFKVPESIEITPASDWHSCLRKHGLRKNKLSDTALCMEANSMSALAIVNRMEKSRYLIEVKGRATQFLAVTIQHSCLRITFRDTVEQTEVGEYCPENRP